MPGPKAIEFHGTVMSGSTVTVNGLP
eukprot:SAG22_NODE_9556_length_583_cov_1.229339_1_plen_25_part_01